MKQEFVNSYPDFGPLSRIFDIYKNSVSKERLLAPESLDRLFTDAAYKARLLRRVRMQWGVGIVGLALVTLALILILAKSHDRASGGKSIQSTQHAPPAKPAQPNSAVTDTVRRGITGALIVAAPKQHTAPNRPTGPKLPYNYICNEAEIRTILIDIQLGKNDKVDSFYRHAYFHNNPTWKEAVHRWDAGIRVTNPEQFERKKVQGIGWMVTLKNHSVRAPGMDVSLTIDSLESEVRLSLTDMQLGADTNSYRKKANQGDIIAAEALRRWEKGIRVLNPDYFKRKILDGKWKVTGIEEDRTPPGMTALLSCD